MFYQFSNYSWAYDFPRQRLLMGFSAVEEVSNKNQTAVDDLCESGATVERWERLVWQLGCLIHRVHQPWDVFSPPAAA